jgi:hypothetical protein
MNLSFSALAIAAMAGPVAAKLTFEPPIPFTQYDGDCSGDTLYTGEVLSIKTMEYGSFCIADNIMFQGETSVAYSRVDIVECQADKIYENWNKCTDAECTDCEAEYRAFTGWDSIMPNNLIGHCYDYTFSADAITKSTRKVAGTFEEVMKVNFAFDESANAEDAQAYVELMDKNSCIDFGRPIETEAGGDVASASADVDADADADSMDSGASTASAASTVALAAAAAMMVV